MNLSHTGNRGSERRRVFEDLEWEASERELARRSVGSSSRQPINLSSQIEHILAREDFN